MNVSLYIAKRYLRSKSSNNAINIISIIAVIGIILGAASLFIVLSGFAGLKDFTLQFSTIVDPDLKAETTVGKSFFITDEDLNKLNHLEAVAEFSKVIEERVIVASNDKNYLATIKGVDAHFKNVVAIDSVISQGSWLEQNTNQIVVGWGISNNLSFGVLNYAKPINLYVPKPGTGQITSAKNAFNSVNAVNVGVFDINETLNDTYVFTSINLAQNLLNYKPNQVSSIEFKLNPDANELQAKEAIQTVLGDRVIIKNRAQLNDALYKMLNTENLAVYLIFTLVLIIALFNVIGSIIMMILDKKKSLNTLFNLGATIIDIRKIFFLQGTLMSVLGGLVGLGLALIILVLQKTFDLVMITPSLAYPVTIKTENFFIVFITISVLGILASKIASARITKALVQTQ
ncbi:ABC transporter permease [Hwangdonia lutea]|uniref:ABC transporter permease n=1 Tax=Hwangdonia lutea TaxID=3075823 RepID=A0AA97ENQ3_9FLAO|nr:ABC transporter permease [Hwangdonia sp. SCSIO 19198]WOD44979.1 ABC transporter permease [Hwangdonia sp. SCSIO 19198]